MENIKRIKHISHDDLDGYSSTILTELYIASLPEGTTSLEIVNITNPSKLSGIVNQTINEICNYDLVIITDLAITQAIVDAIAVSGHSDKFRIFDHHETKIEVSKYDYATIRSYESILTDTTDGFKRKTCGAKLYYDFLIKEGLFDFGPYNIGNRVNISHYIETVRLYDTYEFTLYQDSSNRNIINAPRLNTLFHILSTDEFRKYVLDYMSGYDSEWIDIISDSKEYPWVSKVLEIEERRNEKYISNAVDGIHIMTLEKSVYKNNVFNPIKYTVGVIFAEKNTSAIGNRACNEYPEIDLCAVISNNTVGLRTVRDDVNVSELASLFGGGGHKKAAGFSISQTDANWLKRNYFVAMTNIAGNIPLNKK